jgi:hypothetical protein
LVLWLTACQVCLNLSLRVGLRQTAEETLIPETSTLAKILSQAAGSSAWKQMFSRMVYSNSLATLTMIF